VACGGYAFESGAPAWISCLLHFHNAMPFGRDTVKKGVERSVFARNLLIFSYVDAHNEIDDSAVAISEPFPRVGRSVRPQAGFQAMLETVMFLPRTSHQVTGPCGPTASPLLSSTVYRYVRDSSSRSHPFCNPLRYKRYTNLILSSSTAGSKKTRGTLHFFGFQCAVRL
jgi:hypothetical protein